MGDPVPLYLLFQQNQTDFVGGGKINSFLAEASLGYWNYNFATRFRFYTTTYPGYDVIFVGHGSGAAMATVLASYVVAKNELDAPDRLMVVTFGSPMVGDKGFVEAHQAAVRYRFRITHRRDTVVDQPFLASNFRHVQPQVHYYSEDEMRPGAAYRICAEPNDRNCSISKYLGRDGHYNYYDMPINYVCPL